MQQAPDTQSAQVYACQPDHGSGADGAEPHEHRLRPAHPRPEQAAAPPFIDPWRGC